MTTVGQRVAQVAEVVSGLGIPVHINQEQGPHEPGINVYRLRRKDHPSSAAPWCGVGVAVMYEPNSESERLHDEWVEKVRAALLVAYPDRFRPMYGPFYSKARSLIEDPDTEWTRERSRENARRVSLGWDV